MRQSAADVRATGAALRAESHRIVEWARVTRLRSHEACLSSYEANDHARECRIAVRLREIDGHLGDNPPAPRTDEQEAATWRLVGERGNLVRHRQFLTTPLVPSRLGARSDSGYAAVAALVAAEDRRCLRLLDTLGPTDEAGDAAAVAALSAFYGQALAKIRRALLWSLPPLPRDPVLAQVLHECAAGLVVYRRWLTAQDALDPETTCHRLAWHWRGVAELLPSEE